MAEKTDKKIEDEQKTKKFRMTLSSKAVEPLEKVTKELVKKANEDGNVKVRGPVRLPTKHLKMTIRKSPCGEGSKTWDRYEMRIHKRVIDFECSLDQLRSITKMDISQGVEIELNYDVE